MNVIIRNPIRKDIQISGQLRVEELLRELDLNAASHIVIRNGELLTRDDILYDDDNPEVVSATSGG